MTGPTLASPSNRVRVGCDLVELTEIENSLATFGDRYLRRMFTEAEQADASGANRVQRLAARFAAKEATIKALAAPESPFAPLEIEIVSVRSVPTLRLSGAVARLAARQGWRDASVSLSHSDCHAMAVVVALCADINPNDSSKDGQR